MGTALAASTDTRDVDSSTHAGSSRDNAGGGDALGLAHEGTSHSTNSDNGGSNSESSSERSEAAATAPATPHRSHLGWQSLLPGSIQ